MIVDRHDRHDRSRPVVCLLVPCWPSRALHETLSKKRTVICENIDATSLDNQVIDRSG